MEKLIESYSFHSTPARSMGTRLWKALPSQNHCEKWFIPRNLLIIVIRLSIGSRWLNKRPTTTRRDVKLSSLQPLVNSEDGHPMLSISLTPKSIIRHSYMTGTVDWWFDSHKWDLHLFTSIYTVSPQRTYRFDEQSSRYIIFACLFLLTTASVPPFLR